MFYFIFMLIAGFALYLCKIYCIFVIYTVFVWFCYGGSWSCYHLTHSFISVLVVYIQVFILH